MSRSVTTNEALDVLQRMIDGKTNVELVNHKRVQPTADGAVQIEATLEVRPLHGEHVVGGGRR